MTGFSPTPKMMRNTGSSASFGTVYSAESVGSSAARTEPRHAHHEADGDSDHRPVEEPPQDPLDRHPHVVPVVEVGELPTPFRDHVGRRGIQDPVDPAFGCGQLPQPDQGHGDRNGESDFDGASPSGVPRPGRAPRLRVSAPRHRRSWVACPADRRARGSTAARSSSGRHHRGRRARAGVARPRPATCPTGRRAAQRTPACSAAPGRTRPGERHLDRLEQLAGTRRHDRDPVAEEDGFLEAVRDEEHGAAVRSATGGAAPLASRREAARRARRTARPSAGSRARRSAHARWRRVGASRRRACRVRVLARSCRPMRAQVRTARGRCRRAWRRPRRRARTARSRARSSTGRPSSPGTPWPSVVLLWCDGAMRDRRRPTGRSSPATIRRNVDLPHPDGPTIETNSPSATSRSNGPERAQTVAPASEPALHGASRDLRPLQPFPLAHGPVLPPYPAAQTSSSAG